MLASPVHATILFNGSFETVGTTGSFAIDDPTTAGENATVADWTATPSGSKVLDCLVSPSSGNTNLCPTPNWGTGFHFWINPGPSPDGGNYVAIDGDQNFSTPLTQSVSGLAVGETYILTFYQAAAQQQGFDGNTTEQWEVIFGSSPAQFSTLMHDASHSDVPWMSQSMSFVATATTEVLQFIAVGTPNGEPPFVLLDGVSLAGAPEPGSFALIGAGLLAVAVVGRGLRKKRS